MFGAEGRTVRERGDITSTSVVTTFTQFHSSLTECHKHKARGSTPPVTSPLCDLHHHHQHQCHHQPVIVVEMSSELDKGGPERGRDLPTERGRLLQLSSKVKQELAAGPGQDLSLSLLQESSQFGRGRLLEMSRMRQGGAGGAGGGGGGAQGSRSGHGGQPKGILVIR